MKTNKLVLKKISEERRLIKTMHKKNMLVTYYGIITTYRKYSEVNYW